jgi:putative hydrolase of the HAD superfamily
VTTVYLFDWGDTLMVDIPGQAGKMCDWKHVEAVAGAKEALAHISRSSRIYVATNAAESTPEDIEQAFERAGLSSFISGYFCRTNLGIAKGTPDFYEAILRRLEVEASAVTMVGDSFDNDISPALEAGLHAIWLTADGKDRDCPGKVRIIGSLSDI